nr:MAG TPA: hypothetical protein [Caudoviricetes sp.]
MKQIPNDIISTLLRCLPIIIDNVVIPQGNTRVYNSVRQIKIIIKRLSKIKNA